MNNKNTRYIFLITIFCISLIVLGCTGTTDNKDNTESGSQEKNTISEPTIQEKEDNKVPDNTNSEAPENEENQQINEPGTEENEITLMYEFEVEISENYLEDSTEYLNTFKELSKIFEMNKEKITSENTKNQLNHDLEMLNAQISKMDQAIKDGGMKKVTTGEFYQDQQGMLQKEMYSIGTKVKAIQMIFKNSAEE